MAAEKITVTFKVPDGQKYDVELTPTMTVRQAKEAAAGPCNVPASAQRLICRGRILKDADSLSTYGISTGHTIHMVKLRGADPPATTAAPAAANVAPPSTETQQPQHHAMPPTDGGAPRNPVGGMAVGGMPGGLPDFSALLGGGGGMLEMLQNPAMQQMIRTTMQNPEFLRTIIQSNPMLSSIVQSNPMLSQALENPAVVNSMLDPSVLSEMMQQGGGAAGETPPAADRAAAPGMPGLDFNALRGSLQSMMGGSDGLNSWLERIEQNPEALRAMETLGLTGAGLGNAGPAAPAAAPQMTNEEAASAYEAQLNQLREMGFTDRNANIVALRRNNGDVNSAIAWLLDPDFSST